jgi:hypothetical protein
MATPSAMVLAESVVTSRPMVGGAVRVMFRCSKGWGHADDT